MTPPSSSQPVGTVNNENPQFVSSYRSDQNDGPASSAPQKETPTSEVAIDVNSGLDTIVKDLKVCESFFEILNCSKFFVRNCGPIESLEQFSENLREAVERNKVEKLLLTFRDQLRNKLSSSELFDTNENTIKILTTNLLEAAKEFLKLSKTNLECILKRRTYAKVNDFNLQVISLICSQEFYSCEYDDFDFL